MTLGEFREMTQYLPNSVELNIVHGDEYFPVNCFVGRGNTLALSPGGYDKMADAKNTFVALARLGRDCERFKHQYLNIPKYE